MVTFIKKTFYFTCIIFVISVLSLFTFDYVNASTSSSIGGFLITQNFIQNDNVVSDTYNFANNKFTYNVDGVDYYFGLGENLVADKNANTSDLLIIDNIYTFNLNFWYNQPCIGKEGMSYTFKIIYGLKESNRDVSPQDIIKMTSSSTCSYTWLNNYTQQFTCTSPGDSYIGSSLNFNLQAYNNQIFISTIGIEKNISYTCEEGLQGIINSNNQNTNIIINNQNQNTQDIIDSINGSDNPPINTDNIGELEEIESGILNENILTDIDNIEISIDSSSSDFIWNLVTRIINTNTLIFGLIITMLSLGIFKLVLNR